MIESLIKLSRKVRCFSRGSVKEIGKGQSI